MITWTPEQDAALMAVNDWLKAKEKPFFLLDGPAGTGKTELAKAFAQNVFGRVHSAAFTGKAASVLIHRGMPGATTIHKLIYQPADKSRKHLRDLENHLTTLLQHRDGAEGDVLTVIERDIVSTEENIAIEKQNLKRPGFSLNMESALNGAAMLLIDEYSQVDDEMGRDLLSFGVPILALGDRNQLPPVFGEGYFSKHKPDFTLTQIHRQAKDNPIIRMSQDVLSGKGLAYGSYGSSRVCTALGPQEVLEAEQIIVGRNATRYSSNVRVRQLRGFQDRSPFPLEGERIVCLRNNHPLRLLNGSVYSVLKDSSDAGGYINLTIQEDGMPDDAVLISSHRQHFLGKGKDIDLWDRKDAEEFDYSYALTCHKAQGSQFSTGVVFDESAVFKDKAKNWLYTAVTRFSDWVRVVRR